MNAIEFVKKFGIKEAKRIVEYRDIHVKSTHVFKFNESCVDNGVINGGAYLYTKSYNDYSVSVDDLKQIFDAFDLVESKGGVERSTEILETWAFMLAVKAKVGRLAEILSEDYDVLKHALDLVEKCNES
ncbi:MAG: hypothetical protein RR623_00725 [Bacilli bacterium]